MTRPGFLKRGMRYRYRLVAAMLLVSVPLMVVLALLLTRSSSSSLTSSVQNEGEAVARSVTLHLEDWLTERQEHLQLISKQASGPLNTARLDTLLNGISDTYDDYDLIEITDLHGKVLASSKPGTSFTASGQHWLTTAASGKPALTSLVQRGDHIEWVMAQPLLDAHGDPEGVVAADLSFSQIAELLNPELDQDSRVVVVDNAETLLYDTDMGAVPNDAALIAAGSLGSTINDAVTQQAASTGEPGVARFTDQQGRDLIAGYDILDECGAQGLDGCVGWTISAQEPAASVLAPVNHQRDRAILIVIIGTLLAVAAALLFGTREAKKLRAMADETSASGVDVNSAAAELSASSDELAATTTQQSAAVTQATSTTEELARASAAIADTVDDVASQTAETKDNLEQAEADITLSSERTLALAHKVNDIDALLDLINEIADQTNLLALNAAIEAARAGENGLGFAVVADEVRRLAERSKTSAGEINTIIRAVQGETNATVMAMEKGAKQMQRGLMLLEAVTDANAQVRMTTQQQRSATSQVVETMEQLTDSSRQVSTTADQIASAAGNLADLAGNLENSAKTATTAAAATSNGHG
jgi:Methyl-accepting chemotaxis protein (MCP) signalling domain/Cache domain